MHDRDAAANLTNIPALLAASRATIDIAVAWGEMDALGHVNNVVYFRYLECSRIAFIRSLGLDDVRSVTIASVRIGFILQSVQCRFRRPVVFPDTLRITARLTNIAADRFTLAHEIMSTSQQVVAAVGEGTIVTYDYENARKIEMPAELRSRLDSARA
jgi:acyl-CoA thioester hydrolase